MWAIHWQSRITGHVGNGQPIFKTFSGCLVECEKMDKLYPDLVHFPFLN